MKLKEFFSLLRPEQMKIEYLFDLGENEELNECDLKKVVKCNKCNKYFIGYGNNNNIDGKITCARKR